eukprot:TRINITY_DN6257_c0_g1_i1.p1 TRINITY_DN6257_c0_g1~~TRINITY_DN6257_c0_g1_i1.p1  ORF type:complete len:524 (+),score=61.84 TRINITY_DN6257_c0_g1_i1:33-1574(+)
MKTLSILLLLTIPLILSQSSCIIELNQCIDALSQTHCMLLKGNFSLDASCQQRAYTAGLCCVHGSCVSSTEFLCVGFLAGEWRVDGDCSECQVPPSCCQNGICEDNVPVDACTGVSSNRTCGSGYCFREVGACCGDGVETCYDLPEVHCSGSWYRGETCNSTTECYFPRPDNVPSNSSQGRCCRYFSDDCSSGGSDDCGDGFHEPGLSCSDYPCYPLGVCLRDELCIENSYQGICEMTGGTFLDGGKCTNETVVACHYLGRCNYVTPANCIASGGSYGGDLENVCEDVQGACYNLFHDTCVVTTDHKCGLFSEEFYPGEQCGEEVDPSGHCCIFNFCERDIRKQFCYFRGEENRQFFNSSTECPISGVCGSGKIRLNGIEFSVNPVPIVSALIDIVNGSVISLSKLNSTNSEFVVDSSTLASGKVNLATSSFTIRSSEVNFDSLALLDSILRVNPSSVLTINSCLQTERSKIYVNISDEEESILEQQSSSSILDLPYLSYTCSIQLRGTTSRF